MNVKTYLKSREARAQQDPKLNTIDYEWIGLIMTLNGLRLEIRQGKPASNPTYY